MTHGAVVDLPDGFSQTDWFNEDPDMWLGLASPLTTDCECHAHCECDDR